MQTCKYLLSKYQKYLKKLKNYHLKIEKFDPKKIKCNESLYKTDQFNVKIPKTCKIINDNH